MPKANIKRQLEAKFCTSAQKWIKFYAGRIIEEYNANNFGPVEFKYCYDRLFNFKSGFKKGQLEILTKIKYDTVCYKISDIARINSRPWDLDVYTKSKTAVAIQWHGYNKKTFYLIDPEVILEAIKRGKKSMSEEDAARMAFKLGYLNR